jgi:hypothetical protein
MKLRFVEGGAFDSRIIRWDSRCRWSHVELLDCGDQKTFGAQLNGGVRWRGIDDLCYKQAVAYETREIRCERAVEDVFFKFLLAQDGKPYDWRAIVSFGLGSRDWREDDSWFCSELQARALEVAGLLKLPDDIPVWRITPRDLWVLIAGIGAKQ